MNDMQQFRVMDWFEERGDETLRLNYSLDKDSIVFDVGGYHGDWTDSIYRKYGSTVHVFEPIKKYADLIQKRFEGIQSVKIYPVGLSNRNEKLTVSVQENSTSLYKEGEEKEDIELIDIVGFLKEKGIQKIDLLKVNIEGGEYDLLEVLIRSGLIDIVDNIQVQFHDFVENSEKRMHSIQEELKNTHFLTYQFEFVWENWRKKVLPKDLVQAQKAINDLHVVLGEVNNRNKRIRDKNISFQRELIDKRQLVDSLKSISDELNTCRTSKEFKFGYIFLHPIKFLFDCIKWFRMRIFL